MFESARDERSEKMGSFTVTMKRKSTHLPPRANTAGRMGAKPLANTAVDNTASSVLVNLMVKSIYPLKSDKVEARSGRGEGDGRGGLRFGTLTA